MRRAAALAVLALALTPAGASAHSLVRVKDGELRYVSADAISLNTLRITATRSAYRIVDPTVEGGLDPGPCAPGDVDRDGYIREVTCPARGIERVHVDLGTQDDSARIATPVPAKILGGPGRDALTGSAQADLINGEDGDDVIDAGAGDDRASGAAGDDRMDGGAGADILHAGTGADSVSGGDGADDIRSRDDIRDEVACGEGADALAADPADAAGADCETVTRAAGSDTGLPPELVVQSDRVAPQLLLGGPVRQRAAPGRRLVVLAASSEAGALRATCVVRAGRARYRLARILRRVEVDGEGLELEFALPARVRAAVLRAIASGRGARARFTVVAADRHGNRTVPGVSRTVTLAR